MNVSQQLRTAGHVTRGRLGVGIQDVNQALAESFGLDKPRGALVANVEKGGPRKRPDSRRATSSLPSTRSRSLLRSDLPAMVARATPGKTADVEVWRDGSKRSVRVELGELNEGSAVAANRGGDSDSGRLGLQVRPLSPDERREADLSNGLVVEDADGAAAEAGIRPATSSCRPTALRREASPTSARWSPPRRTTSRCCAARPVADLRTRRTGLTGE